MSEPTIDRLRRLAATPVSRWRSADLEWVPRPAGVEGHDAEVDSREFASWLADWTEAEAGRAVQDDGLRAVAEIVSRHTHQGRWAMTRFAGEAPEDDCLLCRALVDAGVLTIDDIGEGTRAAIRAAPPLHDPQEPER